MVFFRQAEISTPLNNCRDFDQHNLEQVKSQIGLSFKSKLFSLFSDGFRGPFIFGLHNIYYQTLLNIEHFCIFSFTISYQ